MSEKLFIMTTESTKLGNCCFQRNINLTGTFYRPLIKSYLIDGINPPGQHCSEIDNLARVSAGLPSSFAINNLNSC